MAKLKQLCLGLNESEKTLKSWNKNFKIDPAIDDSGDLIYSDDQKALIIKIHHLLRNRGFTMSGAKLELSKDEQINDQKEETISNLIKIRGFLIEIRNAIT